MIWIHTGRLAAKVVKFGTYRTVVSGVGLPVSKLALLNPGSVREPSVAKFVTGANPDPASGCVTTIFDGPEVISPLHPRTSMTFEEPQRLTFDPAPMGACPWREKRELSATTLAEFRRLFSHAGLLVRLVVGRAAPTALPHSTLVGG